MTWRACKVSRDYEFLVETTEALVYIEMIQPIACKPTKETM